MKTLHETISELRQTLIDYIEATYHISSLSLIKQRRKLLEEPGSISQTPFLESTPKYKPGVPFAKIDGIPQPTLELFELLSIADKDGSRLIYDPPYIHQEEAIRKCLVERKNIVIMTGTGSGKTESFLLPILGKLAVEAAERPEIFKEKCAVRAILLYPMNALVNDQLGRLRRLVGSHEVVSKFSEWCGRPPRFAQYTGRTPYAGVRTSKKDTQKLAHFGKFYIDLIDRLESSEQEEVDQAMSLMNELKLKGKWPGKPNFVQWFGNKGKRWQDNNKKFVRAITGPMDSELLTRHEVQENPPDLLVTNYSMLEYMLLRPIERTIFDKTRNWLEENPKEDFLIVLDEAHLYRGSAGAEVGLLIRRLRDRIGITPDRFRVVCSTASFENSEYAPEFGSQLSGIPSSSFVAIKGELYKRKESNLGTVKEAEILLKINLDKFYEMDSELDRIKHLTPLFNYRGIENPKNVESALFSALKDYSPISILINKTMESALEIDSLSQLIFEKDVPKDVADYATTVLLALGSIARPESNQPGLLPCRVHCLFRGLPGLWVCMDADCSELEEKDTQRICGKMYSQPIDVCKCGARVLELYTCRNCGTAYARAYTNNVENPQQTWVEPGKRIRTRESEIEEILALDLLLETPLDENSSEPVCYDLETGQINPDKLGERWRNLYINQNRFGAVKEVDEEDDDDGDKKQTIKDRNELGIFKKCAVCSGIGGFGRSYVQDHQTKGDQPFQAIVSKQVQIQPPEPKSEKNTAQLNFAPLRGRKVITFSDSRQVAARLAPNLQLYSNRDCFRPLIAWGYRHLLQYQEIVQHLSLEDLPFVLLLASSYHGVRLRPELKSGESLPKIDDLEELMRNNKMSDSNAIDLAMRERRQLPKSLLNSIVTSIQDRFYGFEALAIGSLIERSRHVEKIQNLPNIPGLAEDANSKQELVRAWLRCWRRQGFWLNSMPTNWWGEKNPEGVTIRGVMTTRFKKFDVVLNDNNVRKIFRHDWLPTLMEIFTESVQGKTRRLLGSELTLQFKGDWQHCNICKSVHRPIPGVLRCLDCGNENPRKIDPDTDTVFQTRKGYYRKPVSNILKEPPRPPMAIVASEHTAQLNTPQQDVIFSKAEKNELLFQDINLSIADQDRGNTAIDVLSSTTTMEVGIDIGALSGVALRNMPPGRANYQQRAGRAGRRGNSIATVIAFGSADSHDEHYFSKPAEIIRGKVIDPVLTLDNPEIVRRHIRAFLLQNYHEDRIKEIDTELAHNLFSVLGSVTNFKKNEEILNVEDFKEWLNEKFEDLHSRVSNWIPGELSESNKSAVMENFKSDSLKAIVDAIEYEENIPEEVVDQSEDESTSSERFDQSDTRAKDELLTRLLHRGILPKYAFPTDVISFHVFDNELSNSFMPRMLFAPSQSLPIALSQYAPDRQIWISGKCYTSGAIYSQTKNELYKIWKNKLIYKECTNCGYGITYKNSDDSKENESCVACGKSGIPRKEGKWITPPGFAHPAYQDPVTTPDEVPEISYATKAKLKMKVPDSDDNWVQINNQIRGINFRDYLLVSNSGPKDEGYNFCTLCGRIEASTTRNSILFDPHEKPFPTKESNLECVGNRTSKNVILGTEFITDIALFTLKVSKPINLLPGVSSTIVALQTLCESLAMAACNLLEIEPRELMAGFRPSLTDRGKLGQEVDIFLYDTLPGGGGFSGQLVEKGEELFQSALDLLKACPSNCDCSCYRCLRSYKNRIFHGLLDRHIGIQLLENLVTGKLVEFNESRLAVSSSVLFNDLKRNKSDDIEFGMNVQIKLSGGNDILAPIVAKSENNRYIIVLTSALTGNNSFRTFVDEVQTSSEYELIIESELLVRNNLPSLTQKILSIVQN